MVGSSVIKVAKGVHTLRKINRTTKIIKLLVKLAAVAAAAVLILESVESFLNNDDDFEDEIVED